MTTHGNRSVSSACGSTDALEALGIFINLTPVRLSQCSKQNGLAFLSAPAFYPVLKPLARLRRSLGVLTVFNLLRPLLNPAPLTCQLVGVSSPDLIIPVAKVSNRLGIAKAWVVCAQLPGGRYLDELSISGPTEVANLDQGQIEVQSIVPSDAGLEHIYGRKRDETPVGKCAADAVFRGRSQTRFVGQSNFKRCN